MIKVGDKSKKAQGVFGMPFVVIFSIILIVVFLAVAIYAIIHLVDIGECSKVKLFIDDFKTDVKNSWLSEKGSTRTFSSILPSYINYVCFADLTKESQDDTGSEFKDIHRELKEDGKYTNNMFFYPTGKSCIASVKIEHINPHLEENNPNCIPVANGKIEIKLEKEENLVKVS